VIRITTLGQLIKSKRNEKGLLLRHVAAYLDIDLAILSKIEMEQEDQQEKTLTNFPRFWKLNAINS
jgi:cytoskeletal protein RodZ